MSDGRTEEQKARSKRAHANSMIAMGALTTACALAGAGIALMGGDLPGFMYGRWRARAETPRPALRAPRPSLVDFAPWGPEPFARAAREKKYVLLHLSAPWARQTRWMEETVYGDPACAELARERLVPVAADVDARPDLASRYLRGVPTTALLLPDGRPVVAGTAMTCPMFKAFVELVLKKGVDDTAASLRSPGAGGAGKPVVAEGGPYFPDWEKLDAAGLPRALKLEDPVWGGFYRYSSDPAGARPEYERLLADQARAVKALSTLDPEAARRTLRFVERFLALPGGGYAASLAAEVALADGRVMDGHAYFALDDAGRRAHGLPAADRRLLAGPNAMMAESVLRSPDASAAQKRHARRTLDLLWSRLVKDGEVLRAAGGPAWEADRAALIAAEQAAGRGDRARRLSR